jgi:hypothetical protein
VSVLLPYGAALGTTDELAVLVGPVRSSV